MSFAYGSVPAVEDVSLCIHYGELAAILGPNGGGKSTLIKLALGLLQPDSGRVRLFGRDVNRFNDWGRVGYTPQVVAGAWRDFPATVAEVVAHGTYRGVSPVRPVSPFRTKRSVGRSGGRWHVGLSLQASL